MEACNSDRYLFQICNHNLLLADAIHRGSGHRPILPDIGALIIDEAHKLPETARQMFGITQLIWRNISMAFLTMMTRSFAR